MRGHCNNTLMSAYLCVCVAEYVLWGFDYCMNPVLLLVCVCVCRESFSILARSAFSVIGLQRGSGLAGGWPADHKLWPLSPSASNVPMLPIHLYHPSSLYITLASSWETLQAFAIFLRWPSFASPPPNFSQPITYFCQAANKEEMPFSHILIWCGFVKKYSLSPFCAVY